MSKNAKKKLCWSCEGRVAREAENCPYCGVYLSPNVPEVANTSPAKPLTPPYTIPTQANQKALAAPYQPQNTQEDSEGDSEEGDKEVATPMESNDTKAVMIPLILLLAGSVLFIFGATLYLFSHNGVFTLRWNGDYWMYYLLLALPMLIWGWLSLGKINDTAGSE
jgi:hypothetical protein